MKRTKQILAALALTLGLIVGGTTVAQARESIDPPVANSHCYMMQMQTKDKKLVKKIVKRNARMAESIDPPVAN